ncbi:hypothetical protein FNF27_05356 [Cafeteria roenbergensis]|uniref:CTLH domain-containing protein n=1 Tax=Cafeteria roenbergensis TaxID=33653 RepID=A0A5A8EB47_CAFRO|nr:hypothetical protein FNF27_05356 [Cafeteria roenbergensis]
MAGRSSDDHGVDGEVAMRLEDIVVLVQDFLEEQGMLESARALEKESLIARASMGDELTALRSLVLDGRWDAVESVLRPMHGHPGLDTSGALLAVRRQRFLELFEGSGDTVAPVAALVEALRSLEPLASRQEFSRLTYCLTLDSLEEHPQYADWTPARGRADCFAILAEALAPAFQEDIDAASATAPPRVPGRLVALLARAGTAAVSDRPGEDVVFDPLADAAATVRSLSRRSLANEASICVDLAAKEAAAAAARRRRHAAASGLGGAAGDVRSSFGGLRRARSAAADHDDDDGPAGRGALLGGTEGGRRPVGQGRLLRSAVFGPGELGGGAASARPLAGLAALTSTLRGGPRAGGTSAQREAEEAADARALAESGAFSPGRAASGAIPGLGGRLQASMKEVEDVKRLLSGSSAGPGAPGADTGASVWDDLAADVEQEEGFRDGDDAAEDGSPHPDEADPAGASKLQWEGPAMAGAASLVRVASFEGGKGRPMRACGFDPTGTSLAVGSNASWVKVLSLPQQLLRLGVAGAGALPGAGSSDAEAATLDVTHTWDQIHGGSVYDLDWAASSAPDARDWAKYCGMGPEASTDRAPPTLLATGSNDATAVVLGWRYDGAPAGQARGPWPLRGGQSAQGRSRLRPSSGTVRCVRFASPGVLVTGGGSSDGSLSVWDAEAMRSDPLSRLRGHAGTVHALSRCAPGDGLVLSASDDGSVRLWDVRAPRGDAGEVVSGLRAAALCVGFCPDAGAAHGGTVAVGMDNGDIALADLRMRAGAASARPVRAVRAAHSAAVRSVAFSPRGGLLLSASFDGTCRVLHSFPRPGGEGAGVLDEVAPAVAGGDGQRMLSARWHPWAPLLATTSTTGVLNVLHVRT